MSIRNRLLALETERANDDDGRSTIAELEAFRRRLRTKWLEATRDRDYVDLSEEERQAALSRMNEKCCGHLPPLQILGIEDPLNFSAE